MITQQTIAQAAKVDRSTVSLALRDDPQIPEKTRKRIKKIAEKLGYRPNNYASALASLQNAKKTQIKEEIAVILGINRSNPLDDAHPEFKQMVEGISDECQKNNYSLEIYWYYSPQLSGQALFNALKSRNIRGLILFAISEDEIKFSLNEFSCINLHGASHRKVAEKTNFPIVTVDEHFAFQHLLDECVSRGYKRIGLSSNETANKRLDNLLAPVLHNFCQANGLPLIPPVNNITQMPLGNLDTWISDNKPDLIIEYQNIKLLGDLLRRLNYSIPEDIGLCTLKSVVPNVSGNYVSFFEMGKQGAELLINQLKLNLIGPPQRKYRQCVQATWHEGDTLRKSIISE